MDSITLNQLKIGGISLRLKDYLKHERISYKIFAYKMGVQQVTVYRWASGDRIPPLHTAIEIEDATNGAVTCRDWINAKSE